VEFANDVSMGLSVSGQGYALAFVPEARVVHESASAREAGTGLRTVSAADIEAAAHNLLVAVAGGRRGLSRLAALAFWFTVGTSTAPGPIRAAVGLLLGDLGGLRRLRPAFRGKRAALATLRARPADAPASRRREAAA
jgi:hypothetical protein